VKIVSRQLPVGISVSLCTILFALCTAVEPQSIKPARIGWLSAGGGGDQSALNAFRDGMRDLGYVEGRNLVIDARWGKWVSGSP